MKKVKCSHCHGTGQVTCSICKGSGRIKCPTCRSYGYACPVCTKGWDTKPGYVKDKYGDWVHCPNCHGDYTNNKFTCWRCGGDGLIDCDKTTHCSVCHGTGKIEKFSEKNIRVFRALGMISGIFGIHYAYVKRWGLFAIQLILIAGIVALSSVGVLVKDLKSNFYSYVPAAIAENLGIHSDLDLLALLLILIFSAAMIHGLIGMACVKYDGKGYTLNNEFKSKIMWSLFLLFGFSGAHLAYGRSKTVVFHAIFNFIGTGTAIFYVLMGCRGHEPLDIIEVALLLLVIVIFGYMLGFVEALVARFFNKEFFARGVL